MDSFSINEIGKFLDCEISGDVKIKVNKISSLGNADQNSVSFFSGDGYLNDLKNTKAKVLILKKEDARLWKGNSIYHPKPHLAFALLSALFKPCLLYTSPSPRD